jgi:alkyl sulfatase BDS1-like metallo-beta-lactamase superfamily hydrolase
MDPCVVTADDGRVVWDNDAYSFLGDACPGTANPSLWRQSRLCAKQGLFEVTEGIYQVRGLDLSNMTLVEGAEGVIVIDPLISRETAAAALALYREHRGDRPVTAVIYTHAHGDHFGGVHGVYREGVPIVAGHGFMDAAVAENVYAGAAMNQRDLYAYLHDQTLRLMNQGYTGIEIAEMVQMPPALEASWHAHGYYGSVSHNVKAIYQRYLGWFDGNPANLWQHPPVERGTRYVDAFGGADALTARARRYIDDGDLRFAAEMLNHVVFADETNTAARDLLAGVYDTLGFGAENGTWRNFYLQGAYELRNGVQPAALDSTSSADMIGALSVGQLFDSLAIRVNGPKSWEEHLTIDWTVTDLAHTYRTELTNGVLIQHVDPASGTADLTPPPHEGAAGRAARRRTAGRPGHHRGRRCPADVARGARSGPCRLRDRHAVAGSAAHPPVSTQQRLSEAHA